MAKEFRIPFSTIQDPQTLTAVIEAEFKARGLNLHVHEVEALVDDYKTKERVLRVKNTKYFI